eukprot:6713782-Karenia_brevis.AAC.1
MFVRNIPKLYAPKGVATDMKTMVHQTDASTGTQFPKPRRDAIISQRMSYVLGGQVHGDEQINMIYDNLGKLPMVGYSKRGVCRLAARRQSISE